MRGLNNRQNKIQVLKKYDNSVLYKSPARPDKSSPDFRKNKQALKFTVKHKDSR
jgi:hypothetical protein